VDILQATRSYESWLARHTSPVRADLRLKHERMAESAFVFLRGTFYRWIQEWPRQCPALLDAPRVRSVGDLHVENFGTWRDVEGRLVWGVNDVDEACVLPYAQDLVRLATSAMLAAREGHLQFSATAIASVILDGYRAGLKRKGRAFLLAESSRWLRTIATSDLRDPTEFWGKLAALRRAPRTAAPHRELQAALPDRRLAYKVVRRVAGVGSLGRPRFVAVANWHGGFVAREAKAWVPSASAWARGRASARPIGVALLARAVRVPDPFFRIDGGWVMRRLAPDCSRIELSDIPRVRDEKKLLRAMGFETANLHLGTPGARARIAAHLARQPERWLEDAANAMAQAVTRDWRSWVRQ
jgi:uncharacterized protein (DUF2252 family)